MKNSYRKEEVFISLPYEPLKKEQRSRFERAYLSVAKEYDKRKNQKDCEMIISGGIIRERRKRHLPTKCAAALIAIWVGMQIVFPTIPSSAQKVEISVNPTTTTPGLSLGISSNNLVVTGDAAGTLNIGQLTKNSLTTSKLDLDVATTGAAGYQLYATTSGVDGLGNYTNALVNTGTNANAGAGAKIEALAADSTQLAFPAGRWGFSTATTLEETSVYKALPVYNYENGVTHGGIEIAESDRAIPSEDAAGETPFTIGIKSDGELPSGNYTNGILFTIFANPITIQYTLQFDGNSGGDAIISNVPEPINEASADVYRNITIPDSSPTRAGYNFLGWAESVDSVAAEYQPGDSITLQVTDINESQSVTKTLYAVWSPKGEFMQDFDQSTDLIGIGETKTLYDKRDGKTYTVKRLSDGNVWMTQNLSFTGGDGTDTTTKTSGDVAVSTVLSQGSETISFVEAFASGSDPYLAQARYDGSRTNGAYYSWTAAQSVCPAGWRLPSGESGGDFSKLDIAFGGDGVRHENTNVFNKWITVAEYNYPGYYNGSTLTTQDIGRFWSSTTNPTLGDGAYGYKLVLDGITDTVAASGDSYGKQIGLPIRCVADTDQPNYIQDFDAETELLSVGDRETLYDLRDGKSYGVQRMEDGKVWMEQNLAITGKVLTANDTDIEDGVEFDMTNVAQSENSEWCLDTNSACNNLTSAYMTESGGYYNWYTSTAGAGTYGKVGDVAYSICPKGWRLPTGGASGDYAELDVALGGTGANTTDAASYNAMINFFPLTGYVHGSLGNTTTHSLYWTATGLGNNSSNSLGVYTTDSRVNPVNTSGTQNGFPIRCITGGERKKYLQDFNDAIDLRTIGDTGTYYDKRDGKSYTVKRLIDGKVWMMQDLALEGPMTLTPAESDVTSNFNLAASSSGWCREQSADCFNQSLTYNSDNSAYGTLYNWYSATAGGGTYATTSSEVSSSICPKGWHLPVGGANGDFVNLDKLWGGNGANRDNANTYNNFVSIFSLAGYMEISLRDRGTYGGYWASTGSTNGSAYSLAYYGPRTYVYPQNGAASYKYYGFTVRCIADHPNVFFMQDFDESTQLPNTGDSATLTDNRDQKTYNVTRLSDGNVWMTQNLRLGDSSNTMTLTSEDSNVEEDYTLPVAQTSNGTNWGTTPNSSHVFATNNEANGNFYNYYTATAGTNPSSGDAASSVCPKGWKLPTYTGFSSLLATYGRTVNTSPLYLKNAGYYEDTAWVGNGSRFDFWSSTASTATTAGHIYSTTNLIDNKKWGFALRCVADDKVDVVFNANGGTGTMARQSLERGVRQAIPNNTFTRIGYTFIGWALTPDATTAKYTNGQAVAFDKPTTLYAVWKANYMQEFDAKVSIPNVGDSTTLIDQRDGGLYTAKRLSDGKVWMTQNLRYIGSDAGSAVTEFSTYNTALAQYRYGNDTYGTYYSWTAAQNVCPTGWHLPSRGTSGEFDRLYTLYGGTGTSSTAPYSSFTGNSSEGDFKAGGYYAGSTLNSAGNNGFYWSSTEKDTNVGYRLYFSNSGDIVYLDEYQKYNGYPVRCVANETETVSFDANGGTGTMADMTVEKGQSIMLTNGFENPAYNFLGFATSDSAATAEYTSGQTITVVSDMELYAVWSPKGELMQDFDQDTELTTVGETKTLYDKRDGITYTVKRLSDGKVWMTQNMKHIGEDVGMAVVAFSTSDSTLAQYRYNESSNSAYYSWTAAQSVCPAGWHLPSRGTNGEFDALYTIYGGTGTVSTTPYDKFIGSSAEGDFWKSGWYIGSSLNSSGTGGAYWSRNANESTGMGYRIMFQSNTNVRLDEYTKYTGYPVRCIADYEEKTVTLNANGGTGTAMEPMVVAKGQSTKIRKNTYTRSGYNFLGWSTTQNASAATYTDEQVITVNEDITLYAIWQVIYMQDFDSSTMLLNKGDSATLKDKRDNVTYTVKRLEDGKAWMTQNLRFTGATDMNTNSKTSGSTTVSTELSQGNGTISFVSGFSTTSTSLLQARYNGNKANGAYYSWNAATVVCPAGWKLPSGNTNGDYAQLDIAYGGNGTSHNNATVWNRIRTEGNFNDPGIYEQSTLVGLDGGRFWSSSPDPAASNTYAFKALIMADGQVTTSNNHSLKSYGMPVRCIAN